NTISWWENTAGDGTAWTEHTVDPAFDGAAGVAAADVDGDGDLDILGAAYFADDISWWENTAGDGTAWTEHTVDGFFARAEEVAAADVDGDGDLDILGAAQNANTISWWENTAGDGTAWTEHTVDPAFDGAASVAAADVDGDGDLDILGAAFTADDISWWENKTIHRSATYPTEHTVDAAFDGASSVAAADVDGDGDLDILGAAENADAISWWENTAGDGTAWTEHTVDPAFAGASSVAAADVDGDGDLDILGAALVADDISWWENTAGDGTAWTEHTVDTAFNGARSVAAADVDGDGDLDILGAARIAYAISWWENTAGDGTAWTEHTVDPAFDGAISVAAADVDGDGDLDILGAAYIADAISWWENTAGDGTAWTEHTVDTAFDGAASVAAADVDGDGDLDILGAARIAYHISWWEKTAGDGTAWTKHTVDPAFAGTYSVAAADVDGDGDLDILGAAYIADDISWWENTAGDGTAWTEHTVDPAFDGAYSVAAADVDGDGDLDILGAADLADDISWWENRGGQFALATIDTAPTTLLANTSDDILQIEVTHQGRSGDSDLELVTLELLFQGCLGTGCTLTNLTTTQAGELFDSLLIYKDTGSGIFEIGTDTLVATVNTFALTDGVQIVSFVDGDANVQVAYGTPQTFFVVVDRVPDIPATPTVNRFTITHITEASSTAEDRATDIPLALQFVTNAASKVVQVLGPTAVTLHNFNAANNNSLLRVTLALLLVLMAGFTIWRLKMD
ncbi:MAG TPA: VCBS repeat-containing protein, partial [Anaerolineae bacterium]|nr:VCBS repeat-containing protein [Anaerolineae bacterium]